MIALTRLAEKVEAGTAKPADFVEKGLMENISAPKSAWKAYHGSLDAAKALHEVVLPGWWFAIQPNCATVGKLDHPHDGKIFDGKSANTARAWLLAILRALASTEPH